MALSRFSVFPCIAAVAALALVALGVAERLHLVAPMPVARLLFELPALAILSVSMTVTVHQVLRVLRSYRINFGFLSSSLWPAPQTGTPQLTAFA